MKIADAGGHDVLPENESPPQSQSRKVVLATFGLLQIKPIDSTLLKALVSPSFSFIATLLSAAISHSLSLRWHNKVISDEEGGKAKPSLKVRLTANESQIKSNDATSKVFRLAPGSKDNASCGYLIRKGTILYISEAKEGFGKLHPCMMDKVGRGPDDKPFDIATEEWVPLMSERNNVKWVLESIGR